MPKRPVLITAGGTGGHVYPGLAVARLLIANDIPVIWMGTRKGLEARVIPEAGIEVAWLDVSGLRGKGGKALLLAPFKLLKALYQSFKIMRQYKPSAVLGMGGFVSGPGGLVAALMGIPVIIHEQNAVAGLTNKLLSVVSRRVLEGFPNTFTGKKVQATGNPVRHDIATLPMPQQRMVERKDESVRILVIGGSLGAVALNETVPAAVAQLPLSKRPIIRHQAGEKSWQAAEQHYAEHQVEATVTAFIEDMAEAYAWADLLVCRSGALTVAELAAAGVGAILVPYPYAVDDHQTDNARYLSDAGAAVLVQQSELTPVQLAGLLDELCADRSRLLTMAQTARDLAKPNATQEVTAVCASYAGYELIQIKVKGAVHAGG